MASHPANPDQLSPSQRERLERLRSPAVETSFARHLADQIDEACEMVERVQLAVLTARDDQDMAWLMLCHRGWPRDVSVEGLQLTLAFAWLAAWSEWVTLPVEVVTPLDRSKRRWVQDRLSENEAAMQRALPAELWQVVGPLDATGRATLAYVLQALATLTAASAEGAAALRRRDELFERFAVFRQQARRLGMRAPLAPLDVRAWQATSVAVRRSEA